mgnify:CR=1 FL=1
MLSQENQQVFVLNGIQTMSGYVYNLGNELTSMHGLVDMVRLSPMGNETFAMLEASAPTKTVLRHWILPAIVIATATGNGCPVWCCKLINRSLC